MPRVEGAGGTCKTRYKILSNDFLRTSALFIRRCSWSYRELSWMRLYASFVRAFLSPPLPPKAVNNRIYLHAALITRLCRGIAKTKDLTNVFIVKCITVLSLHTGVERVCRKPISAWGFEEDLDEDNRWRYIGSGVLSEEVESAAIWRFLVAYCSFSQIELNFRIP